MLAQHPHTLYKLQQKWIHPAEPLSVVTTTERDLANLPSSASIASTVAEEKKGVAKWMRKMSRGFNSQNKSVNSKGASTLKSYCKCWILTQKTTQNATYKNKHRYCNWQAIDFLFILQGMKKHVIWCLKMTTVVK